MAVRPIAIHPDGTVDIWHDEASHGGTVRLTDLRPGLQGNGQKDFRFTQLACPVPDCGAVSVHPASGGCDPDEVQRLFAHLILANPALPARTWLAAKAALKQLVEALDGPGRWRLEDVGEND